MNQLVRRESIEELCGHRDVALRLYGEAFERIQEAGEAVRRAAPSGYFALPKTSSYGGAMLETHRSREEFDKAIRVTVDRAVWSHLMKVGQFETLMDHTARKTFREQMAGDDVPEATVENCWATFSQLMGDSGLIFRRGVAVAFSKLDRRFKTHDGFKIGSKIILTWFCHEGSIRYGEHAEEMLRDVERTFHTLDGSPHPDRMAGIVGKANSAMGMFGPHTCDVEDDYFRLRCFKNGNAHLWFKRPDLVEKVNKLLAQHYGAVLGDGAQSEAHRNREGHAARDLGFFPTPAAVAEKVVEHARLYTHAGDTALRILEPSAGGGALVRAAWEARGTVPPTIEAVELSTERWRPLADDARVLRAIHGDFLEMEPITGAGGYDRILMNPPFDRGRDVDHVLHALKFLACDGRLVAVMSSGAEHREDKRTLAFRELLASRYPKHEWIDLPAESFKEAGTLVNTVILVVNGPECRLSGHRVNW